MHRALRPWYHSDNIYRFSSSGRRCRKYAETIEEFVSEVSGIMVYCFEPETKFLQDFLVGILYTGYVRTNLHKKFKHTILLATFIRKRCGRCMPE